MYICICEGRVCVWRVTGVCMYVLYVLVCMYVYYMQDSSITGIQKTDTVLVCVCVCVEGYMSMYICIIYIYTYYSMYVCILYAGPNLSYVYKKQKLCTCVCARAYTHTHTHTHNTQAYQCGLVHHKGLAIKLP
jgi:hypothetical protein